MRLKSEIWVAALLRRCQGEGKFGAVIHHGADEAGSVYIIVNHLNGTCDLLGPPPGSTFDDEGERRFVKETKAPASWQEVNTILARHRKFDSDIWAVEIEDRDGLAGIVPMADGLS